MPMTTRKVPPELGALREEPGERPSDKPGTERNPRRRAPSQQEGLRQASRECRGKRAEASGLRAGMEEDMAGGSQPQPLEPEGRLGQRRRAGPSVRPRGHGRVSAGDGALREPPPVWAEGSDAAEA